MLTSPLRRSTAAAGALAFLLLTSGSIPALGADAEGDVGSFSAAGVFPEERGGVAATSLADGRILFVGGDVEAEAAGASAYRWDPIDQDFAPAGALHEPRLDPTATLLPDGRVLVIGGFGGLMPELAALDSAEIWDPATGMFSRTGPTAEARSGPTATLLLDGRVLVVGGVHLLEGTVHTLGTAELWDPATGMFSPTGALAEARFAHTATPLPDGRVLVIGGFFLGDSEFETRASAEIWDPATEMFSAAESLPDGRDVHTATLLPDGRVLVVGGVGDDGASILASAVLWDPATESFSPSGALQSGRAHHTATPLPDGAVLIVGGSDGGGVLRSAEMWDPTTGVFHPAGSLVNGRSGHTATLIADGRVLIAGGSDYNGMFTASAESWSPTSVAGSGE